MCFCPGVGCVIIRLLNPRRVGGGGGWGGWCQCRPPQQEDARRAVNNARSKAGNISMESASAVPGIPTESNYKVKDKPDNNWGKE